MKARGVLKSLQFSLHFRLPARLTSSSVHHGLELLRQRRPPDIAAWMCATCHQQRPVCNANGTGPAAPRLGSAIAGPARNATDFGDMFQTALMLVYGIV